MTMEQTASTEPVPVIEPAPAPTVVPPKPVEPVVPQPLTSEQIQQMIATAVTRAVEEGKQLGRRELQSVQDRNKAEAIRSRTRAEVAERTLGAVRTHLQGVDPDVAKEMELAELRERERTRQSQDQTEEGRRAQEEFLQTFYANLNQHITGLGVDPKDPKIDWGAETMTPLEIQRRVLDSAAKIQKESQQTIVTGFEKRLRDLEAKQNQANVEANSVSTAASAGVVVGSDAEFIKKLGSGELPLNKANQERYNKIQKQG